MLLLRAEFINPHDGRPRRGYRTHLSNGSTNKPLCGCNSRAAVGDGAPARWLVVGRGNPTCSACVSIQHKLTTSKN